MAKLTKREKEKMVMQMRTVDRGNTWSGIRPSIMHNKAAKYNTKVARKEGKALCREY